MYRKTEKDTEDEKKNQQNKKQSRNKIINISNKRRIIKTKKLKIT